MGNLTVRGMAGGSSGLEVDTDQKMGVITLGGANKADFCAGAKYRHASNVGDLYSTQGAIKSVAITGWRGASGYLFVDSNFSAATIGKCILKNVNYSNASLAFGVWGQRIASVKLVDTAAPSDPTANFTWKPGSSAPAADLNILLLT